MALAPDADLPGGGIQAGVVAIWEGGPLAGTPAPRALLYGLPDMHIGETFEAQSFRLGDLDGDGILDLIASSLKGGGWVLVWFGGDDLNGTPDPDAILDARFGGNDFLGAFGDVEARGPGLWLADVTGDGQLDVLAVKSRADVTGVDNGVVLLFPGGPGLSGMQTPLARLSSPEAGRLGAVGPSFHLGYGAEGPRVEDLTGDGIPDLAVAASFTERSEQELSLGSEEGRVHRLAQRPEHEN